MEKSRKDEDKRREKSKEGVETTRNIGKKKRREQVKSNRRKKIFCL